MLIIPMKGGFKGAYNIVSKQYNYSKPEEKFKVKNLEIYRCNDLEWLILGKNIKYV